MKRFLSILLALLMLLSANGAAFAAALPLSALAGDCAELLALYGAPARVQSSGGIYTVSANGVNCELSAGGCTLRMVSDTGAVSGERAYRLLLLLLTQLCSLTEEDADTFLTERISLTQGEAVLGDKTVALAWSADGLSLTITPAALPEATARPETTALPTDLLTLAESALPVTEYRHTLSITAEPDALLMNIYFPSDETDRAKAVLFGLLKNIWTLCAKTRLTPGRLSVMLYTEDMRPIIALGISAEDALAFPEVWESGDDKQIEALLTRLCEESDAMYLTLLPQ